MESAGTAYFGYAVPTIRLEEWFVGKPIPEVEQVTA